MLEALRLARLDWILFLTAISAGTVDVISFATLGNVFASAMTGNLALLAYHVARSEAEAALGSMIALGGFGFGVMLGAWQRRGRTDERSLNVLLAAEAGLLLLFALYSPHTPHTAFSGHFEIVVLSLAMGIQAVIGQTISLTTVVFTTTLTRLVIRLADYIAERRASGPEDVKLQGAVVVAYLFGALLAATLVVRNPRWVVMVPFPVVAAAFVIHRSSRRRRGTP